MEQPDGEVQERCDETSEEEWTYTKSDNVHWLVQKAEELVRDSPIKRTPSIQAPLNKISRVKEWLNMKKPDDSCDASGEDDEQESQTSEEFNESIVTYRQAQSCESQSTSVIDLAEEQTPKVIKRGKLNKETRPWSVSCISQLEATTTRFNNPPKMFSTSESALYNLSKDFNEFTNGGLGNNSTSSTVEEGSALVLEEKCSPTRRKRFKLKKRCDYNRISHGTLYHSSTLVKSGSFSGHPCVTSNSERHSVSDPSALYLCHFVRDSTTSGTDSDDERKIRRTPNLKSRARSSYLLSDVRSGSPAKSSILAVEEQSSSMSEQAWDGFQEDKYLSEPYSEAHDSDAARKLLEFGEDYGNYLDNQSDWSNQSTTFGFAPSLPRNCTKSGSSVVDSNSDSEDLKYLLKEYNDQLVYAGRIYKNQLEVGLNDYLVTKDKDLLDTCNQYINSLSKTPLLDNPSKKSEVSDLITNWHVLKERAVKMQEYFDIQKDVLLLKDTLRDIKSKLSTNALIFNSVDDLTRDIDFYTNELSNLQEQKRKLLSFNVTVHRFITTNKEYNTSFLRLDVPDLYRLWYDVHCSANDKIDQLNNLKQAWQMLEARLEQLRNDLREDKVTLDILENALNSGTLTNHVLASLKEIEKLLSETQIQGYNIPELFLEGSCSDSGISDEGSEHELGEREHRLTAIRRLVKQLETLMNPECAARIQMNEEILAAEEELRNLQRRCRNIMSRSATPDSLMQSKHLATSDRKEPNIFTSKSSSWFNRVTRLSLPLQFAAITLLCVAYFAEPQCCNNMNTFAISLTPHLNYIRGPPPI